jgi:hypothetical protein
MSDLFEVGPRSEKTKNNLRDVVGETLAGQIIPFDGPILYRHNKNFIHKVEDGVFDYIKNIFPETSLNATSGESQTQKKDCSP